MEYMDTYRYWLSKVDIDEKEELLGIEGNEEAIKRRFAMPLEFGTAGMRGIIALGTGTINRYTVARATLGLAKYILSLGEDACRAGVVISYDTRNYSYEYALVTAGVLAANKIQAYLFNDVRPVPVCSFAIRHKSAAAGVMITASHNPKEYNGYKVYGGDGAQMSPEATARVVEYIDSVQDYFDIAVENIDLTRDSVRALNGVKIAPFIEIMGRDVDDVYFKEIQSLSLSPEAVENVASKIKIVYTPLHGAGYKPVIEILGRMNIPVSVVEEQRCPDGNFPTVAVPNPEQPEALSMGISLAKELRSDIVIGTDPDCDRMGAAIRNNKGEFVTLSGNQIGAMLMDYILMRNKERGTLPANAAVIKTIVTTNLADMIAKNYGVTVFNVLTGFKFIGEKIKEWESTHEYTYMFGYEESFGYLSGTHARDKDAVVATMLFAEMACYYENEGVKLIDVLESLFKKYGYFAEVSRSIAFGGLDGMQQMRAVMDKLRERPIHNIAGLPVEQFMDFSTSKATDASGKVSEILLPKTNVIKFVFNEDEWACVRPSGTEPKLKIYVSVKAENMEKARQKNNDVLGFLEELVRN